MATPIASFGSNPQFAEGIKESLLPEFEVVHVSLDVETALAELPAISSGNLATPPASGLGSNATADAGARKAPKAIIFAGSLPEADINKVKDAVAAVAAGVKPIVITKEDVAGAGGPPNPQLIGQILKKKLLAANI